MRCDLCNGVSYQFVQRTSDDITVRKYRCKKCKNIFNTIERKVIEWVSDKEEVKIMGGD